MIVIVDDHENIRYLLKNVLEKEGYEVFVVENGLRLSVLLKRMNIDLILLDINLPWMSGIKICRSIINDKNLKNVKIIYITGKMIEDEEELYKTGCYAIIPKPFKMKRLIDTISQALNLSNKESSIKDRVPN